MPARGHGFTSPRDITGRKFAEGVKVQEARKRQEEAERKALSELARNGSPDGENLEDLLAQHPGADVYTDPSGTVVIDYTQTRF